MNEFARFMMPEAFESGLERRLLIGEVVVGQICKIRIEHGGDNLPTRHVEATISIVDKQFSKQGEKVSYFYQASVRSGQSFGDADIFNADSIALSPGTNFRTYLSDDIDPRWDASLSELIDIESNSTISV